MTTKINTAMVLAAGLGTRIRPLMANIPKPLIPVIDRPLIDYSLDTLLQAGVTRAIVNVHHKADMIEQHLMQRTHPEIIISDERNQLMETGGALLQARPFFDEGPVFCTNTDSILLDAPGFDSSKALLHAWNATDMDVLLLLCRKENASGFNGNGDFSRALDGRLTWPHDTKNENTNYIYTGLQIIHPTLLDNVTVKPQSARVFWEKAMAKKRLFGVIHEGRWMHVGDQSGHRAAETTLRAVRAGQE